MKGFASSATKSAKVTSAPERPEDQHAHDPTRHEAWWKSCIQSYLQGRGRKRRGKETKKRPGRCSVRRGFAQKMNEKVSIRATIILTI